MSKEKQKIPSRSDNGNINRDLLLAAHPKHTVCYYFEDEGYEEFYERFLDLILGEDCNRIVICTGGKTKMNAALTDFRRIYKKTPVICIQDKDYDDIIGDYPENIETIVIGRYCFENYLINEEAILKVVVESKRRLRRGTIKCSLNLSDFFQRTNNIYAQMTKCFIYSRKFRLSLKTTKQSIYDIIGKSNKEITDAHIEEFKNKILLAAQKEQKSITDEDLNLFLQQPITPKSKYSSIADNDINSHLCGKHLLELTISHLDANLGLNLQKIERFEIAMRILNHIPTDLFSRIRISIENSIADQKRFL